jgi:argininosuccinate lyase
MSNKPWEHAKAGGGEGNDLAARFVESLSYDTRLYKHDITGSIAHARMLRHVGLIADDDLAAIEQGLHEIEAEIDEQAERWGGWQVELEDVHMCIEAALIEKIGDPGRKLHTGRSRNDQIALDLRLWMQDALDRLGEHFRELQAAIVELAGREGERAMPSYTHLQRAQPIVVGAELLGWADALETARRRCVSLTGLWRQSPLGSGAIAGSSLPLDRGHVAGALLSDGGAITTNSIESTASRDPAIDFVYALSMAAMWLSRWAEQWIIYMSAEFGFLTIGEAFTTGSSMMPQKRNPDMLELIRGRCGNVYGHLMALLTMCKGLTVGYNRDLQEDKRHVFAAYDTVCDCLDMAARIVRSAQFNERRIGDGLDRGFLDATSLAEYLVTKGVPFRSAHQVVGEAVRHCEATDRYKLEQLTVDELNETAARHGYAATVGTDVHDWLGSANVVGRYQTRGNAGLSGFQQQLAAWHQRLNEAGRSADGNQTAR